MIADLCLADARGHDDFITHAKGGTNIAIKHSVRLFSESPPLQCDNRLGVYAAPHIQSLATVRACASPEEPTTPWASWQAAVPHSPGRLA